MVVFASASILSWVLWALGWLCYGLAIVVGLFLLLLVFGSCFKRRSHGPHGPGELPYSAKERRQVAVLLARYRC